MIDVSTLPIVAWRGPLTIHDWGAAPQRVPVRPTVVAFTPCPTRPSEPHQARLKRLSSRVALLRYKLLGALQGPGDVCVWGEFAQFAHCTMHLWTCSYSYSYSYNHNYSYRLSSSKHRENHAKPSQVPICVDMQMWKTTFCDSVQLCNICAESSSEACL
jgi:hypothetical protein